MNRIQGKITTKEDNISFENETKFAILETPRTNQNCMHEEIMSRLYSRNVYYNLNHSLVSFCLLRVEKLKYTELQSFNK